MFHNFRNIYNISLYSPVNIPMGGYYEVYTSLDDRSKFTYANLRKASYTGKKIENIQIIMTVNTILDSVQVLDDWRNLPLHVL